jgi:hypothetical protein
VPRTRDDRETRRSAPAAPLSAELPDVLNNRERATLRAVALGHAEMTCSCEPDLFIDGLACCDQSTAHRVANAGYVVAARDGRCGERVPARITATGIAALGDGPAHFLAGGAFSGFGGVFDRRVTVRGRERNRPE